MAEEPEKPDKLESREVLGRRKLDLEVKELEQKLKPTGWSTIGRLVPIIVPSITLLGLIIGAVFTYTNEGKKYRLETITNLKRDFASENPAVRISAVYALADYPKEAIPILIGSLGNTKAVSGEGQTQKKEDTDFTIAVKDSLMQIGQETMYPLIKKLKEIQKEIREALMNGDTTYIRLEEDLPPGMKLPDYFKYDVALQRLLFKGIMSKEKSDILQKVYSVNDACKKYLDPLLHKFWAKRNFYLAIPFRIFNVESEDIQDYLKTVAGWNVIKNLDDEEIRLVAERLASIWSSRREAILANKNGTEVLADLLSSRKRHWFRLPKVHKGFVLTQIDLSGAILERANLSGADFGDANLSGAVLCYVNLSGAKMWRANLSGANLYGANLSGANLHMANLSGADLWDANLSGTNLLGASLSDAYLERANLSGAKMWKANLSGAILCYANLSGADLWNANLSGTDLEFINGFREVKNFTETDMRGMKHLSREDREYARSKGAIIDEAESEKSEKTTK